MAKFSFTKTTGAVALPAGLIQNPKETITSINQTGRAFLRLALLLTLLLALAGTTWGKTTVKLKTAGSGEGNGGNGASLSGQNGLPGLQPGGGGGGSAKNGTGGKGGDGMIVITYTVAACEEPAITGQPSTDVQNLCVGTTATTISVTATGDGLQYQWYSNTTASNSGGTAVGTNSASYTPLTATASTLFYYVVVSGDCGTPVTSDVSGAVTVNALPTFTYTTTDPECFGVNDGTITITASGGSGTYQYSKDGGANWQGSNVFSGLGQGSYTIQVKDSNGCIQTNCTTNP